MKYYLSLFVLLSMHVLHAQEYKAGIYQAYLQDRMDNWKVVMDQMEQEYQRTSEPDLLFDLLVAEYGYTGWLVSGKEKKEAEEHIKKAEMYMTLLREQGLDDARVYALAGAFYGYKILLDLLKAPSLGKLSKEANAKAMELNPEEPQVWLEKANIEFYWPAIFGKSKRKAVLSYEKAVELFESSPERTRENWVYLNCLAGLGIACESTKNYSEAEKVYKKLLKLEPSFEWVKEDLYPQFMEKHGGK